MPNRYRPSQDALKAARKAFESLHDDQDRFRRNGLGPGEAYIGLWRACHDHIELLAALRKKLAQPALKDVARQALIERYDLIHYRMATILYWIIPYERPKLQVVGPEDGRSTTQRVPPDFSVLTHAELTALEKILLKVGGAAAIGPPVGEGRADPDLGVSSSAPAGRGDGTPKDRKKLRKAKT